MAKKARTKKKAIHTLTADEQRRQDTAFVLKRAKRTEKQIDQLTRAIRRLRERNDGALFDFASELVTGAGYRMEKEASTT